MKINQVPQKRSIVLLNDLAFHMILQHDFTQSTRTILICIAYICISALVLAVLITFSTEIDFAACCLSKTL